VELEEPAVGDSRRRVLLVEDEPLIRSMLAEELRAEGYVVVEAGSAAEALAFMSADQGVDLVFSDIHLAGDLNGLQLAERIQALVPSLPIILTSGNPPPVNLSRYGRFIAKPYAIEEAVKLVADAISGEDSLG
jgi:CheY-like chemotaxis protein